MIGVRKLLKLNKAVILTQLNHQFSRSLLAMWNIKSPETAVAFALTIACTTMTNTSPAMYSDSTPKIEGIEIFKRRHKRFDGQ